MSKKTRRRCFAESQKINPEVERRWVGVRLLSVPSLLARRLGNMTTGLDAAKHPGVEEAKHSQYGSVISSSSPRCGALEISGFVVVMASPSSQSSIGARSQGVGRGQGSAGSRSASLGQRHRELFIKAALSLGAFGTFGVAAAKNAHTYGCPPNPQVKRPLPALGSSAASVRRLVGSPPPPLRGFLRGGMR